MDAAVHDLIVGLHTAPYRYVFAATGGGTSAAAWLLSVPGGSRTLLEVVIPYHERALCEFLGRRPKSFCSTETARAMAERAWQRAGWLSSDAGTAGIGCTASLRSDRPKRGEHRFHLAVRTAQRCLSCSLVLAKGQRDREGEETVLDLVLLNTLAEGFGIAERVNLPLETGERIHCDEHPAGLLAELLTGRVEAVCQECDGRLRTGEPRPGLLLSGSFNPLHEGHRKLAAVAEELEGRPAAFELAVVNADKPPQAAGDVRRRLEQFTWRASVWLTRAPTFAEKARLFPGAVFVVGADTAARIVQPRFYQDSDERMAEALAALRARGCRFLVAGRLDDAGVFRGLDDLAIPPAWDDLFGAMPKEMFRMDISSTHLRALDREGLT